MPRLTVHKTVSWDDRGRKLSGKVVQLLGDHVVVAVGKDKYVVNKDVVTLVPSIRVASGGNGPRYQHDCDKCVFLGQDSQYDLYFCQQGSLPTVIARYGNDAPDYLSGMQLADQIEPLGEAKRLAITRGLLPGG